MASLQMLKKRFTTFLGSIDAIRGIFQSHIKHPLGENNSYLADIELDFRFLASRVFVLQQRVEGALNVITI
jgi:hypothetical protein